MDLSPRLVEILGYLAVRPGETVPKDVLLDRFWQDVHVTENTVDRAMTRIRKAVGFVLTAAGDVDRARTAARGSTVLQLDAVDRTLSFKPGFAPAIFVKAMVFVARQACAAAEEVASSGGGAHTVVEPRTLT